MKLGIKLALTFTIMILIVAVAVAILSIQRETAAFKEELKKQGLILANTLSDESKEAFITDKFVHIMGYIDTISKQEYVVYAMVRDKKGKVRAHSELDKIGKVVRDSALNIIETNRPYIGVAETNGGQPLYDIAVPVTVDAEMVGVAQIGYSLRSIEISVAKARKQIIVITIGGIIAGIFFTILFTKQLVRPIIKLKDAANEIANSRFNTEIEVTSRDEIGELASTFNQMTANLRTSRDHLVKVKDYTENIIKSINDALIIVDSDGMIETVNKATLDLLGFAEKELIGYPVDKIFTTEIPLKGEKLEELIKKGKLRNYETEYKAKDGEKIPVLFSVSVMKDKDGKVIRIVSTAKDITERKKMEENLLMAQKLESVGILAGGIAHDFNNLMTGILGNISLAKIYTKPGDEIFNMLTAAENACLQARNLTQQLLTFSRGGMPVKKVTSITELLKDSARFALTGSDVQCEFSILDDVWPVKIDTGQMSQVINNLIINAKQAMTKGGTIKVRAENVIIDTGQGLPLKEGKYIKISVEDEGSGIPKEHLKKIFDPYFSTKENGSGLGLAVTYSIIEKHGGYITAESELGIGTAFFIYLPASQKQIPQKKVAEEGPLVGTGKILLMDDEEIVRNVAGEMLKHLGYAVEFAGDGAEAIELYKKARESDKPFDAVIMDLTVPGGMGGKEAINKLLEIDPHVKVIVSSGYSNDPVLAEFRKYGFTGMVTKPYNIEELSKILDRVKKGIPTS